LSNLVQKLQALKKGRSVLIVDDDLEVANSLGRILEMFFDECVLAHDGEKAFEKYKNRYEEKGPFTLLVSDLELPKRGGLSLIQEIKELNSSQDVLIISAHDESELIAKALDLGVRAYLFKPLQIEKLFENLEKILLAPCLASTAICIHNSITGWLQKDAFQKYMQKVPQNTTLLLLRLNHLANIYKLIGDEYANLYLKELSALFDSYTAESKAKIFHLDNDEFALILEEFPQNMLLSYARDLVALVRYFHVSEEGIILNSTLSIGIANQGQSLFENAGIALQKSLQNPKEAIHFYTQPQEEQDSQATLYMMRQIYNAIENNQIIPYIQPVMNAKNGAIEIFNSYVRIQSDKGLLEPESFLSLAKESHQIFMITRLMIKNSLALKEKLEPQSAVLSIHLSHEDLFDESLLPYILFWSEKFGINADSIAFETSTVSQEIFKNEEFSLLRELKKKGYKIMLNDFGIENASLVSLLELQPDYIKIDPKLIHSLANKADTRETIAKLLEIIRTIGAKSIATRLSDTSLTQVLQELGVDYIKGYDLHAPYEMK
jgi:EAL domain-containing protein (putative c-di-GMP-specific phosphodiesterase class I)/DNA-binding response OmpR family regulator